MLYTIFRISYVLLFFVALFIVFVFEWGSEGKDERGKHIINKSYSIVFPFLPLGWFIIEVYDQHIGAISYDTYKMLIWFLLTGLIIIHALSILIIRRAQ